MSYCPKCSNIYNISKSTKIQSGGNNIETIIQKIMNEENIDDVVITEQDLENLSKNNMYKKLSNKEKDNIFNHLNDKIHKKKIDKTINKLNIINFVCKNCGNNEPIKEGTLILSRSDITDYSKSSDISDSVEYLKMKILPKTRNYNCPNDKCESHSDPKKKSAVFVRLNMSYHIKYICESCETSWMVS